MEREIEGGSLRPKMNYLKIKKIKSTTLTIEHDWCGVCYLILHFHLFSFFYLSKNFDYIPNDICPKDSDS